MATVCVIDRHSIKKKKKPRNGPLFATDLKIIIILYKFLNTTVTTTPATTTKKINLHAI